MNRIVLAMLAFLAGLVAPVAPAQARMDGAGSAAVGMAAGAALAAKACGVVAVAVETAACRNERRDRTAGRVRTARPRVYIPSVMFGPDRALE